MRESVTGVQIHGDAEQEGDDRGQLAGPPLACPALLQHGVDNCGRDDAGESFQAQVVVERVVEGNPAYHQGHALTPSGYWLLAPPVSPLGQRILF